MGGGSMFTGTIQNQVKMQMLDMKWQQKKQDINSKKSENMTQEQRMLEHFKEQAAKERKRSATSELYTKLQSGGTLTAEEIAYLKENDPEALADYEKAQAEKKAYEQALKNCKTKEDVDRLKLNRMGNFAAQAKSIANNPYIPKEKKLELMQKLNNEVCLIRDAHSGFVKSRAYEELPEEAEIAEENAKENATANDEILAEQMETEEEVKENSSDDSTDITDEVVMNTSGENVPEENEKLKSFEQISQDIENFLRRNGSSKSSFVREV